MGERKRGTRSRFEGMNKEKEDRVLLSPIHLDFNNPDSFNFTFFLSFDCAKRNEIRNELHE